MATEELKETWNRTEALLREARSQFSEAGEALCSQEMQEFGEYLSHNEFELALDMLDAAFDKSGHESWQVMELMARAAASMGLKDRQQKYVLQLSETRGY